MGVNKLFFSIILAASLEFGRATSDPDGEEWGLKNTAYFALATNTCSQFLGRIVIYPLRGVNLNPGVLNSNPHYCKFSFWIGEIWVAAHPPAPTNLPIRTVKHPKNSVIAKSQYSTIKDTCQTNETHME